MTASTVNEERTCPYCHALPYSRCCWWDTELPIRHELEEPHRERRYGLTASEIAARCVSELQP